MADFSPAHHVPAFDRLARHLVGYAANRSESLTEDGDTLGLGHPSRVLATPATLKPVSSLGHHPRFEALGCPLTKELVEDVMKRIEMFRGFARAHQRRNNHQAASMVDDLSDELVLMLEDFLRRQDGGEPCPGLPPDNPEHN
jgi:hypothetical protein